MDSNSNNNKSIKRKLVDPLVEGYEFATHLQLLLSRRHSNNHNGQSHADPDLLDELIVKILGSLHKTISVLESFEPLAEVSVPNTVEGSLNASCGDDSAAAPASGDSGNSRKRLRVAKGKRGCYIRKKRSHSWTLKARKFDEDGYAWRKYGQKEILNTKFPRSYFRCTHKPTQGCKATKLVQKMEQDPEMFHITYIGHHTCNANDQPQGKIEPLASDNTSDETINAQGHVSAKVQEQEKIIGTSMVKEEENSNGDQNKDYCEGSSTDGDLSLVWQDAMMFDDHHQHHQNHYYHGEISTTSHHFTFVDNDNFSSFFDSYCA